jgi:hypothetical protein
MRTPDLRFSGLLLKQGFSIYVFRLSRGVKRYYYVGMTGDQYYPSARSAVHRLSGHLEVNSRSTQDQLIQSLSTIVYGLENVADLKNNTLIDLEIEFFHFPVKGYVNWNHGFDHELLRKASDEKNKHYKEYSNYKMLQKKLFELEKSVIYWASNNKFKVLNKSIPTEQNDAPGEYKSIYEEAISVFV